MYHDTEEAAEFRNVATVARDLRTERIREADAYLAARTGCYQFRRVRYGAARRALERMGLDDSCTVVDVGAGWTELDYHLRAWKWRGRYWPVDACLDGTDLEEWVPPRRADFFVALEVIEPLADPFGFLERVQDAATRAVVVSTPNPAVTDVLGMDSTHKRAVHRPELEACGFTVTEESFYGQPADSLFGVWTP